MDCIIQVCSKNRTNRGSANKGAQLQRVKMQATCAYIFAAAILLFTPLRGTRSRQRRDREVQVRHGGREKKTFFFTDFSSRVSTPSSLPGAVRCKQRFRVENKTTGEDLGRSLQWLLASSCFTVEPTVKTVDRYILICELFLPSSFLSPTGPSMPHHRIMVLPGLVPSWCVEPLSSLPNWTRDPWLCICSISIVNSKVCAA